MPAGFGGSDAEQGEEGEEQARQGGSKRGREEGAPPDAAEPAPAASEPAAPQPAQQQQQAAGAGAAGDGAEGRQGPQGGEEWRPQWALPRERKIAVGQRCKRLIDAARLRWLRRQGFEASIVKYVPSNVSGENRLLLATLAAPGEAPAEAKR